MTPYTIRSHSALLADSSQLTANSFQLTADSFYLLTAFLTTGIDPSRSFRMTFNVPPIMTLFLPIVILNGRKNALRKKRETGW